MSCAPDERDPRATELAIVAGLPRWCEPLSSVIAVTLAVAAVVLTPPGGRLPVACLMAVAVAPWLLRWWICPHARWWGFVTLAALAVLYVGGSPDAWGWLDGADASQVGLWLGLWLVVEDAVVSDWRRAWQSLVAVAAIVVLGDLAGRSATWTPGWLGTLLLGFMGGRLVHSQLASVLRLREDEGRAAREAVAEEQRRVAREVHDVVAHSLSVTALHLTAASMAAGRGDLEATRSALDEASRLNRASLRDLQRTVRVLRDPAGTATAAALPGLADIEALVASFRAAGLPCDLVMAGEGDGGDLVGLTAYRVVQEALTNASRHQVAPTAEVTVAIEPAAVVVTVRSHGPAAPAGAPGHGLAGMRERVEGLGGRLVVGPEPGGWSVSAVLPCSASPATVPAP
jgi:signal transduction histidine kinase